MERLRRNPVIGLFLILLISGLTLYACHSQQRRQDPPPNPPPKESKPLPPLDKEHQIQILKDAHAAANNILNSIEEDDYEAARQQLEPLQIASKNLPSPQLSHPDISPVLGDFFQLYVVQLDRSLNTEEKADAKFEATVLFGISGDFLSRLQPGAVPELERFISLIREFSVWTDSRDEEMLQIRASAICNSWSD